MTGKNPRHGNRWDRKSIIRAIRDFEHAHGRPPTADEWKRAGVYPSYNAVVRWFGSWADAVEEAGFTRPRQGVCYRRRHRLIRDAVNRGLLLG